MIDIWNEVVEDGTAFPQEDFLDSASGKEFFDSQRYTGVAEDDSQIVGLNILHNYYIFTDFFHILTCNEYSPTILTF